MLKRLQEYWEKLVIAWIPSEPLNGRNRGIHYHHLAASNDKHKLYYYKLSEAYYSHAVNGGYSDVLWMRGIVRFHIAELSNDLLYYALAERDLIDQIISTYRLLRECKWTITVSFHVEVCYSLSMLAMLYGTIGNTSAMDRAFGAFLAALEHANEELEIDKKTVNKRQYLLDDVTQAESDIVFIKKNTWPAVTRLQSVTEELDIPSVPPSCEEARVMSNVLRFGAKYEQSDQ